MFRAAALVGTATLILSAPAAAQTASRPGPWALDVRAITSPVPDDAAFYPTLSSATVPTRGYGLDLGVHVYFLELGPSRVGAGANVVTVRSTTTGTISETVDGTTTVTDGQRLTLNMRILAPQISFNFGKREGWSYLSLGAGVASVDTRTENIDPGSLESGWRRAFNAGGGARWFFKPRLAFGFDLRVHRISSADATPSFTALSVGAGLSFR